MMGLIRNTFHSILQRMFNNMPQILIFTPFLAPNPILFKLFGLLLSYILNFSVFTSLNIPSSYAPKPHAPKLTSPQGPMLTSLQLPIFLCEWLVASLLATHLLSLRLTSLQALELQGLQAWEHEAYKHTSIAHSILQSYHISRLVSIKLSS